MTNKPGYKHTTYGWIPDEWDVKKVKDFGKVVTGSTPPTNDLTNYGSEYMFIGPGDLGLDKFIYNCQKRISNKGYLQSRKLSKGSVLFTCIGSTIGKVGIANEDCTCNQQINAIICNGHVSNEFLYYELLRISSKIKLIAGEQALPIINKTQFENFHVIYPPLVEQRRIAAILSTWDEAITKTQQLIAQLRQRNKGLMQQLLTGKKRLAGFEGDWKEIHMKDAFTERNETGYLNHHLLSVGSLGIYPQSQSDKRDISNTDKSKYKRICPNDIGYNTMRMWQGRSALSSLVGIVSPAYTIVTPKENENGLFYSFLFKLPSVVHKFFRNSQGLVEDTLNCKFRDFAKVKVEVPEYNEQLAIADLLSKSTDEVLLHGQKLAALQQQKKGLMQKLLTGEIRVKI